MVSAYNTPWVICTKYVLSNYFTTLGIHMAGGQFQAYLTKRKYTAFKEAYLLYLESTR